MSRQSLTPQLISNSFGWAILSKARSLCQQQAVLEWGFDISGSKIIGRVQEKGRPQPYRVEVVFAPQDQAGNSWLKGQCTCSVGRDCVHAAAIALMAAGGLEDEGAEFAPPADAGGQGDASAGQDVVYPSFASFWLKRLDNLCAVKAWPAREPGAGVDDADTDTAPNADKNEQTESIVYILTFDPRSLQKEWLIEPRVARLLKSGRFGRPRSYNWRQLAESNARFASESDQSIARLWLACSSQGGQAVSGRPLPPPADGGVVDLLLNRIVATGRLYFGEDMAKQLHLGDPREGLVKWVVQEDSRQILQVVLAQACQADGLHNENGRTKVLTGNSPWYVDINDEGDKIGAIGPIKLPYDHETLRILLAAPRVAAKDAALMHEILSGKERAFMQSLPLPSIDIEEEVRSAPPLVKINLKYEKFKQPKMVTKDGAQRFIDGDNIVTLSFDYGFDSSSLADSWATYRWSEGNKFLVTKRAVDFEKSILTRLTDLGFKQMSRQSVSARLHQTQSCWTTQTDDSEIWLRFVQEKMPQLRSEGWQFDIEKSFQYQVVEVDQDWLVEVDQRAAYWFQLDLGVMVDGQRLPLLPIITEAIRNADINMSAQSLERLNIGGKFYAHLPDGRLAALPFERVKDMLGCLTELLDSDALSTDGKLDISLAQMTALSAVGEKESFDWRGAQTARSLVREMGSFELLRQLQEPDGLEATLRPYQKEGLGWLDFISTFHLGGILADDMGLGKTVQTLAHIAREKSLGRMERPFLVLSPTSVLPNWLAECRRLTPHLKIVSLHGAERAERFFMVPDCDIVFSTYPILVRDVEFFTTSIWHAVILDEAQAIKNSSTRAAQAAFALKSKYRICLTGTPIENHLGELWSQFNFLMPGFLGPRATFEKLFKEPIERERKDQSSLQSATEQSSEADNSLTLKKNADPFDKLQLLVTRIKPFLLRRTKAQVAQDLPAKTEMVKYVELEARQRDLYETVRLSMHELVLDEVKKKGLSSCGMIIMDALLKLRQTCCHPALVKLDLAQGVEESAKLAYLLAMLDELIEENRKILIFSQFTSMLDVIAEALRAKGLTFVQLRGDTKDRATPVEQFQNGLVPIFLISLKAGGTGLNLTAADTVIHYDPWWNPAVEDQATGRAHRIGQEKPVFVYRLIAAGTIEERMLDLQKEKRAVAESILGDELGSSLEKSGGLTMDESKLDSLFAPLPKAAERDNLAFSNL